VEAITSCRCCGLRAQRGEMEPERGEAGERPASAANRIDPYALNDLDRRMLKEAFRQARTLQQRLEQTIGQ